jgi:hypothetical protein
MRPLVPTKPLKNSGMANCEQTSDFSKHCGFCCPVFDHKLLYFITSHLVVTVVMD